MIMYVVADEAVKTARINMEKAMEEMKNAKGADIKAAVARYCEANSAYLTMVRYRYNL